MPDDDYDKLLKAYYSCFNSAEGKIVMVDLLGKFYNRTLVNTDRPIDVNEILINEGARTAIIYILSKIEEFTLNAGVSHGGE